MLVVLPSIFGCSESLFWLINYHLHLDPYLNSPLLYQSVKDAMFAMEYYLIAYAKINILNTSYLKNSMQTVKCQTITKKQKQKLEENTFSILKFILKYIFMQCILLYFTQLRSLSSEWFIPWTENICKICNMLCIMVELWTQCYYEHGQKDHYEM